MRDPIPPPTSWNGKEKGQRKLPKKSGAGGERERQRKPSIHPGEGSQGRNGRRVLPPLSVGEPAAASPEPDGRPPRCGAHDAATRGRVRERERLQLRNNFVYLWDGFLPTCSRIGLAMNRHDQRAVKEHTLNVPGVHAEIVSCTMRIRSRAIATMQVPRLLASTTVTWNNSYGGERRCMGDVKIWTLVSFHLCARRMHGWRENWIFSSYNKQSLLEILIFGGGLLRWTYFIFSFQRRVHKTTVRPL